MIHVQLNDLERLQLKRVQRGIDEAAAQAVALVAELTLNHAGIGADHVEAAIERLRNAKAHVDALGVP